MTKPAQRTTLRDVADAAGVSEMTVSRVLRGSDAVAKGTRRRVKEAADRLGYVPNRVAGSLATSRSNQVAIVIPSLRNIVYSQVTSGIASELDKTGYNGVVGITDYSLAKEEDIIVSMLSWRPAAVIVANLVHSVRTRNILSSTPVPVVEIMDSSAKPIDMGVGLDHGKAGRVLVDHLLARGYSRFGYLGWNENDFPVAIRFASIRDHLRQRGLTICAPDLFRGPPDFADGKSGLRRLLEESPGLDAVMFSNDTAAVGGVFHCLEVGLDVPRQLAIAGFSGLQIGQVLPKKLTTIRTERFEVGRLAARRALNAMTGYRTEPVLDVGFELVAGDTA